VQLRVGDKVPAVMGVLRLVTSTLRVEQGTLTGDTNSDAVHAVDTDIETKERMVFAGPPSSMAAPSASSCTPGWPHISVKST
jgi:hypothetical protein